MCGKCVVAYTSIPALWRQSQADLSGSEANLVYKSSSIQPRLHSETVSYLSPKQINNSNNPPNTTPPQQQSKLDSASLQKREEMEKMDVG